jgi:hypothetical protein
MTATHYSLLAALIFALVTVAQIIRALTGLPITIGRTSIPIWASRVAGANYPGVAWIYSGVHRLIADPVAGVVIIRHGPVTADVR